VEQPLSSGGESSSGLGLPRDVTPVLGLAGAVMYGLGWIFVARFYGEVGVSPEEVGVDWLWVLVRVGIAALLVAIVVALATLAIRSFGVRAYSDGSMAVGGWPALFLLVPIGWIFARGGLGSLGLWVSLVLFQVAAMGLAPWLAFGAASPGMYAESQVPVREEVDGEVDGSEAATLDETSTSDTNERQRIPTRRLPLTGVLGWTALVIVASLLLTYSLATTWGAQVADGRHVEVEFLPGVSAIDVTRVELRARSPNICPRNRCTMLLGRGSGVVVVIAFEERRKTARRQGAVWRLADSDLDLRSLPGSCAS
jgi:hypothetical protein